jgi:hypothetical protein
MGTRFFTKSFTIKGKNNWKMAYARSYPFGLLVYIVSRINLRIESEVELA